MSDNLGTAHGVLKLDADVAALIKSMSKASDSTKQAETKIDQSTQKIEQHYSELANQVSKSADKVVAANKKVEESEKRLDSRRRKTTNAAIKRTQAVGKRDIEVEQEKQVGRQMEANNRLALQRQKTSDGIRLAEVRSNLTRRNNVYRTANAELAKDMSKVDAVIRRSMLAPAEMQQKIQAAIASPYRQAQRFAMRGPNVTASMALNQQLAAAVGAQNAAFLVGGGRRPTALGGTAAGGAGGGGGLGILGRLLGAGGGGLAGGLVSGLASGLGIGVGGYALAQGGRALVESTETATAYERQTVAARNLAGSQADLNKLLAAYADASGNAVDKVTSLSNVTRLMATGFANTAPELEKFVRATRGASIALGKPQDYVIQETQLAISNTSVKRLDQIGLGITEVNDRIELLRKTNAGWTREMAFQDAVVSLLDQKYGHLTKTAEGQATGVEKLKKAWTDLRLEVGKSNKPWIDGLSEAISRMFSSMARAGERGRLRTEESVKRSQAMDAQYLTQEGFLGISLAEIIGKMSGRKTSQVIAQHQLNSGYLDGQLFTDDSQYRPAPKTTGRKEEQLDVIKDFYQRFADLEKNYAEQRLNTIQQYEEQRNALVRNYGKMMVREEEDFQRQRARALEDYEFAILEVMRDAQEREAEMQEDLDKRIADLKENGNEKIDEIEEKYQKNREKSFADHRDRLLKAAGQLDAIAVLEERKRWKRENEEAQEGRDEAVKEVREDLNKQIEEAREAHAERLADARKADEDRLRDMAVAREKQLARENEDRAIRLERAKQDHDDQLAELDRQHQLRLSQIATQQAEERAALQTAFEDAMIEVGIYVKGLTAKQNERLKLVDEWFEYMVGKMENMLLVQRDPERYKFNPETGPQIPLDYGSSLRVNTAGTATMQTSNSSKTLSINEGAFQIFTAPGEGYTAGMSVEESVIKLLEGM